MQNFKKMQKSALKICIYEIKAVPLHRQIKNRRRTTAKSAAFLMSGCVGYKRIVSAPRGAVVMTLRPYD